MKREAWTWYLRNHLVVAKFLCSRYEPYTCTKFIFNSSNTDCANSTADTAQHYSKLRIECLCSEANQESTLSLVFCIGNGWYSCFRNIAKQIKIFSVDCVQESQSSFLEQVRFQGFSKSSSTYPIRRTSLDIMVHPSLRFLQVGFLWLTSLA